MIQDLVCEHSQIHSRGAPGFTEFTEEEPRLCALVRQRLVSRHPVSGRRNPFLSAQVIGATDSRPIPEARMLIRDLTEHATERAFDYAQVWRPFGLVMWDNRATMHRARRSDASLVRDARRTTVSDEIATLEQVA